jgi:2-polyprenyl-3-methyl-5-hydroxy-6-metoxy-1,4-benzoquinol methylase
VISTSTRHFTSPPPELFADPVSEEYAPGHATYASYNYLSGGPVARIKSLHFEAALRLAAPWFHDASAIDFGCADGVLLPSLARRFKRVLAVDVKPEFTAVAARVVSRMNLTNVTVTCNRDVGFDELATTTLAGDYKVMFLLEVLEHVGTAKRMYSSKLDFLEQLFGLLPADGRIIISVPTMVGLPFLIQRAVLAGCGLIREPLDGADLLRAGVLGNTDRLEPDWGPMGHLGFNHRKLERALRSRFHVEARRNLVFSQVYMITRAVPDAAPRRS